MVLYLRKRKLEQNLSLVRMQKTTALLCPEVNRRSLQRYLKIMIEKELIAAEGATNQLAYLLRV